MKAKFLVAFAFLASLTSFGQAKATTVTYNLTLTPYPNGGGPEGGYGDFTIVLPPDTPSNNSGSLTLANGGLVSMNIYIDGQHLTANSSSQIGYNYNIINNPSSFQINNIGFNETVGTADITYLSLTSYGLIDTANYRLDTNGALSFAVATTPLPAALSLFAGGLGFVGYLAKRRKKKATATLATA
jgi:hypothetical protein